MPGVYGWDIGGSMAVAAKVEDGGVTVVPNKLTGDRFTPVVVPETPQGASDRSECTLPTAKVTYVTSMTSARWLLS